MGSSYFVCRVNSQNSILYNVYTTGYCCFGSEPDDCAMGINIFFSIKRGDGRFCNAQTSIFYYEYTSCINIISFTCNGGSIRVYRCTTCHSSGSYYKSLL